MKVFFYTSALVKYFHEEEGTDIVTPIIENMDTVSMPNLDEVGGKNNTGLLCCSGRRVLYEAAA
ncbi:MAG: hypothetical protein Q7J38_04700 [Gallionella sp.]|nr:hypothetical protein [Gallionella sp.]